jgi:predicted HTH transcriptional regulator
MFLARYAEKAGSGILDMIARCKLAGLPTPEFRQEDGQFVQRLRRPTPAVTPQVATQVDSGRNRLKDQSLQELASALGLSVAQDTTQVTTQVEKVLTATAHEARSREELQAATSMIGREHGSKLAPLLALTRCGAHKPYCRSMRQSQPTLHCLSRFHRAVKHALILKRNHGDGWPYALGKIINIGGEVGHS